MVSFKAKKRANFHYDTQKNNLPPLGGNKIENVSSANTTNLYRALKG